MPTFWHRSHIGAPSVRRHLILLLRQLRHAACLTFIPLTLPYYVRQRYMSVLKSELGVSGIAWMAARSLYSWGFELGFFLFTEPQKQCLQ